MPEATGEFLRLYLKHYPEWKTEAFCNQLNRRHGSTGGITLFQLLLFLLRDPAADTASIRRDFDEIARSDLIRKYLRPMYRRNNASHEYASALLDTRDDPVWLEDWRGATVLAAAYDRSARCATLRLAGREACQVWLGGAEPVSVKLDGGSLRKTQGRGEGWSYARGALHVVLPRAGMLEVHY